MGNAERVAAYRERMRAQGMKLLQIWVPDTSAPGFDEECHRQSLAIANSPHEAEDQAWVDSVQWWFDDEDDQE